MARPVHQAAEPLFSRVSANAHLTPYAHKIGVGLVHVIFETRAKAATLKTEDVKIRFIRPDVALAHVTNELSGLVSCLITI